MAGLAKRGVFFTFLAILIVGVLLVSFLPRQTFNYEARSPVISARVNYANTYVKDVNSYVEQSLRVSGAAALRALSELINKSAPNPGDSVVYLTEPQLRSYFKDLVLYGTYNDGKVKTINDSMRVNLMAGKTVNERILSLQNLSSVFLHINVSFENKSFDVGLFQSNYTGPFFVGVNITMNYTVNAGIVSWNRTNETVTTKVSIEGLYDPLYYKAYSSNSKSDQSWHLAVRAANYSSFNITRLYYHIRDRRYNSNDNAPSFLQRFYNDFNPSSCCGIESTVNGTMTGFPSPVAEVYVDWCFYSTRCDGAKLWYVSPLTGSGAGKYGNFSLDTVHAAQVYNVTGCLYSDIVTNPFCTVG